MLSSQMTLSFNRVDDRHRINGQLSQVLLIFFAISSISYINIRIRLEVRGDNHYCKKKYVVRKQNISACCSKTCLGCFINFIIFYVLKNHFKVFPYAGIPKTFLWHIVKHILMFTHILATWSPFLLKVKVTPFLAHNCP